MGILVALIVIGIIIFFHEFGHYIFAKLAGCGVPQFSIGWGPKLFSFKIRETRYSINLFSIIGGYVRLLGGDEGGEEITNEDELRDAETYKLKKLDELSAFRKFSIFIGGVLVQVLLCILIFSIIILCIGKPVQRVIIGDVLLGSPASNAGIKVGDVLLSIGGEDITSYRKMLSIVSMNAGNELKFVLRRDGAVMELPITPIYSKNEKRPIIGVSIGEIAEYTKENMGPQDYLFGGIRLTVDITKRTIEGIWQLITKKVSIKMVKGPIGIVEITSEIAKTGFMNLVILFTVMNINIAILNALPFPALDGGHVIMLFIEKLFNIKIKYEIKKGINIAGFVLLICLMLYISYNDVMNLIDKYITHKNLG
ncbi:MAG: RIP metalloprotease RseP [Candidatus Omnitrophica bacterium]|nr:RIP metalloprotease RseP [Candidatus Omnitrophota bacterium]